MIGLDNSIDLQRVINKKLPTLAAGLTPGAAFTFLLLDQINESHLAIIAYGAEGIWTKWTISSTNTVIGTKYLVPFCEFKEVLTKINPSYSLNIFQDSTGIILQTYCDIINNVPVVLDCLSLSSFYGSLDEFACPDFDSYQSSVIMADDVDAIIGNENILELVWQINTFGDHSTRVGISDAVLLNIDVEEQTLSCYSKQQNDPNFFIQSLTTITANTSLSCCVLGSHFAKLANLDFPFVCFKKDAPYLAVFSEEACMLLPLADLETFSYLEQMPAYFIPNALDITSTIWTLSTLRIQEALSAQQPDKNYSNRHITLTDGDTSLALGKQADLNKRDFSNINLIGRKDLITPAEPLVVQASSTGLLRSLKVISHVLSKYKIQSDELNLVFYYRDTPKAKRWVVKLDIPASGIKVLPTIVGGIRTNP